MIAMGYERQGAFPCDHQGTSEADDGQQSKVTLQCQTAGSEPIVQETYPQPLDLAKASDFSLIAGIGGGAMGLLMESDSHCVIRKLLHGICKFSEGHDERLEGCLRSTDGGLGCDESDGKFPLRPLGTVGHWGRNCATSPMSDAFQVVGYMTRRCGSSGPTDRRR